MIEFQYFNGCPNSTDTLNNLRIILADFKIPDDQLHITLVENENMARDVHFQGSPSIIIDGTDIYTGQKPTNYSYSCRLYLIKNINTGILSTEYIRQRFNEIMFSNIRKEKNVKYSIILDKINMKNSSIDVNTFKKCPECNSVGVSVKTETVFSLLKEKTENKIIRENYALCMNPSCLISYYSVSSNIIFHIDDITVPLWYKSESKPIFACYCSRVTKDDVINALKNNGARTVQEINKVTGSMKNADCLHKNPLGKCCHNIIQGIIDNAMNDI